MSSPGPACRSTSTPMKPRSSSRDMGTRSLVLDEIPVVNLSPDPKDNPILATAIAGKADLIISGDKKHILSLEHVEGIPVVTAREALERLRSG